MCTFSQILLGDKNATYLCSKIISALTQIMVVSSIVDLVKMESIYKIFKS